jgi:PAS domain S-box-containing protein
LEIRILARSKDYIPFEIRSNATIEEPVVLIETEGLYLEDSESTQRTFIGSQGIARDITERKKALEAIHESEERYKVLSDASFEGIVITDEGRFVDVNRAALEIFGYKREELIGRSVLDVISPEDRELVENQLSKGDLSPYNLRAFHKDGHILHVEARPSMIRYNGRMVRLSALRDVTDRRRAEEQRIRLQTAIEQTTDAVVISDHQGQIQYVNPAFEETTGYTREEAVGQTHNLFRRGNYKVDDRQGLMRCVTGGSTWSGRFSTLRKDGSAYEVNATISPVRDHDDNVVNYVGVLRDITHEAALEAQLRQAQKMEAIGGLAGGIAHDFNNLLTAIMANSELLRSQLQSDELQVRIVDEILKISDRASLLTRQLLTFSTKQDFETTPINLKDVIAASQTMLGRLIREDIAIRTEICSELGLILADLGQIEQVIMNLVINARDAMPKGGTITIGAKNMVFEADSEYLQPGVKPGEYVVLRVSDTGLGIAEEHLDRIFEPFYTTKATGKGTGLGLATVYGIVRQSGGFINVDTALGAGTTFYICLPKIEDPELPEERTDEGRPAKGQSETILLVEDDDSLGGVLKDILELKGYQVQHASDGKTALEIVKGSHETIDMLVTDMLMPGMNGVELAKKLVAIKPDLKILFISGHSREVAVPEKINGSTHEFLQKPFTADVLHRKIQTLLDT